MFQEQMAKEALLQALVPHRSAVACLVACPVPLRLRLILVALLAALLVVLLVVLLAVPLVACHLRHWVSNSPWLELMPPDVPHPAVFFASCVQGLQANHLTLPLHLRLLYAAALAGCS